MSFSIGFPGQFRKLHAQIHNNLCAFKFVRLPYIKEILRNIRHGFSIGQTNSYLEHSYSFIATQIDYRKLQTRKCAF